MKFGFSTVTHLITIKSNQLQINNHSDSIMMLKREPNINKLVAVHEVCSSHYDYF